VYYYYAIARVSLSCAGKRYYYCVFYVRFILYLPSFHLLWFSRTTIATAGECNQRSYRYLASTAGTRTVAHTHTQSTRSRTLTVCARSHTRIVCARSRTYSLRVCSCSCTCTFCVSARARAHVLAHTCSHTRTVCLCPHTRV